MLAEKKSQVPRNFRLGGVRQTKFLQPYPRSTPGYSVRIDTREEAVKHHLLDLCACHSITERAADYSAAAASKCQGDTLLVRIGKQVFFRHAAEVSESMPPLRIKTTAFSKPRFHQSSQSDVHVVTAEEQVVTDRGPLELELGFAFGHRNQTHVGSATAYVTYQN